VTILAPIRDVVKRLTKLYYVFVIEEPGRGPEAPSGTMKAC